MKVNAMFNVLTFAAKEAPRIYFAPLIGATKAIRAELAKIQAGFGQSDRLIEGAVSPSFPARPIKHQGRGKKGHLRSVPQRKHK